MDVKEQELQRQKEAIGEMRSVQESHSKSSKNTSEKENCKLFLFLYNICYANYLIFKIV